MNQQQISAIILAGGKSTRMGQDKASLPWGDHDILHSIIECMEKISQDILVISNQPRRLPSSVRVLTDIIPQCGPLSGIHAGLHYAKYATTFVISCDMPFVIPEAVQTILNYAAANKERDAVLPLYHGKIQPLFASYQKSSLPIIEQSLCAGHYKVSSLCNLLHSFYLSEELWPSTINLELLFKNLNSFPDYQQAYIYKKNASRP
ncbi:molybdenum cofactor guanylyltransferase [Pelosinus fermentans]|uniref:Probable molybdenum cofactor guanylyltransferase n=1 Tax=Pelosinus fermentans JBW45 TaxID=1192197 RepID=I8TNS2_9FIRM|nr:molybdenum cofactor guanylyltransferase [Pelosinus fermentans]AJQ29039.1 Molybdopterin-guanine dinucleotide biosynthesis protein A [Pelosinus fermentans JBW45]